MELNNLQAEKIAMLNHRRDYLAQTAIDALFRGVTIVSDKMDQAIAKRVLLDKAVAKKLADHSGDSPQKKLTKDKAIKTLGKKARSCATYFQDNEMEDIATVLKRKKTYYSEQKDEDLPTVMANVRAILNTHSTPLAGYGVNAAWFTTLDAQITEMTKWLTKPTEGRQEQYVGDADIDKYMMEVDAKYDQLDALIIDNFEDTNPEEVEAWLLTGHQTTVGVKHNIVDVTVKKITTLDPINRAKIDIIDTVTNLVIKTLYTDPIGTVEFFCQNRYFYAEASADGCITERKLFKPLYRDTFHLDFQLRPI